MTPTPYRQFIVRWDREWKIAYTAILILLALGVLAYMTADLVQINKCTICGDTILGKPERINDTEEVCDRCYSEMDRYGRID